MNTRRIWLPGLLWACFAAGLLVQGFAPNLQIENQRFILPAQTSAGQVLDPRALVERERRMQWLSALLTGGAALGLALCYRELFTRPGERRAA